MPLERAVTDAFIAKAYAGLKWPTGRTVIQHAWEVGEAAAKLLRTHLQKSWGECPPLSITDQIDQVLHAGLLHAAMERCATTFEEVCQITSLEVARIVGDISADVRLAEPQRIRDRIGRMGGGGDGKLLPQVVTLADSLCAVRHYKECIDAQPPLELAEWLQRDLETRTLLLAPLTQVRDHKSLDCWWVKVRDTASELSEACKKLVRQHQLAKRIADRKIKDAVTAGTTCRSKPKI